MRFHFFRHLAIASAALIFGAPSAHVARAEWNVWTVTETRHVLRSETPGSVSIVKIGAVRNEWVDFQILLRSDAPVSGVDVETENLRGPNGAVLDRSAVRLYRQHQVFLKTGTYRNEGFKPDWYPDPLIPFRHPVSGEKLQGARFT